jgi:hypothetical protein
MCEFADLWIGAARMTQSPQTPSAWPPYGIGSHDAVFALGVASVNYARLEFAFSHIFAKVLGITNSDAWALLPKINNYERLRQMRDALQTLNWPVDTKNRVTHFMDGFKILADNRNLLDHSNIYSGSDPPISLYKYDRDGKTIHTVVTTEELRQVADDMMTYFNYGLNFGNSIAPDGTEGTIVSPNFPSQPPLPQKLNYTTLPLPLS